jgi:hypothetical protein
MTDQTRDIVERVRDWLDDEPLSKPPFGYIRDAIDELETLTKRVAELEDCCKATLLAIEDAGDGKYAFGDLWRKISSALSSAARGEEG